MVCRRSLHLTPHVIRDTREKAFTLAETVAAVMILAFISTSVLIVINRYIASAADSILRMQAFEVARKNMEELLTSDSVEESVEYGTSEMYPDIQWETVVESFYVPLDSKMWIQAICSAEYIDSENLVQTVELTHWLTDVSKAELLKILAQQEEELAAQIIETLEEAAVYAGVDEQTIQQWVDNGMLLTEDDQYLMSQLDLYRDTDGNPTIEDRRRLTEADDDIIAPEDKQPKQDKPLGPDEPVESPQIPEDMTPEELMEWIKKLSENR
ncbi:MAG: type IV pilus modification PilV family protein [Planctomycetota bacterium]